MAMELSQAVTELQESEVLYIAMSKATNLPFVTCDSETYNDQGWIFKTEEGISAFGKKMVEDNYLVFGMKYESKDFFKLYGTLYAVGINEIVYTPEDGTKVYVPIDEIATRMDFSDVEDSARPLFNENLQLCGMYFMQELRRPVEDSKRKNIREIEEELTVNLARGEYLIPLSTPEGEPEKVQIPYIKNSKDEILQPIFSDIMEYEKFANGQEYRVAKVPFKELGNLIIADAKAYVVNPLGINLVLDRDQVAKISALDL